MKIHFFSRLIYPDGAKFRADYIRQNLETVRTISVIFFLFDFAFRLTPLFITVSTAQIKSLHEYITSVTDHLFVTPVFVLLSTLLIKTFKSTRSHLRYSQLLTILFALYLIGSGMMASFFAMHNPKNTVTLYMTTLMLVSVFYVFEYYETIFISVVITVAFSLILPHYVQEPRQVFLNHFASVILVIVFYSLSRYAFSYKANHFIQLKTINEKNKQIEITNQAKDEILGIVAHDLRNPLAAIESVAMLMELDEKMDEDAMDNILMIRASCEKARLIINDLIEVARNDIQSEFEVDKTDLNQFLFQIVEEWLHNKNGSVNLVYYGTKDPVYAWINPEKMHRVMDNLISNAIKFSVQEKDNIEVSLRHIGGEAFIDVKDFGVGIPDNLLPNIFDRFSKASRKGVHGEDSVGLGLSIVKQIVSKHGGEINVNSKEQRGTTFTISLNQSIAS